MKYEIINPSDQCYIYAEDVRLAQIAGLYLGNGMYGLSNENGEMALHIFEGSEVLNMNDDEISKFITENSSALAAVFESFEYARERTSLNNIGEKAERFAKIFRGMAQNDN